MGNQKGFKEVERSKGQEIGIGMLGYAFMGRAHSNALLKLPYMMYPPPANPELVAVCGRDEKAVSDAPCKIQLEGSGPGGLPATSKQTRSKRRSGYGENPGGDGDPSGSPDLQPGKKGAENRGSRGPRDPLPRIENRMGGASLRLGRRHSSPGHP